jgi:hypothetical protein
MKSNILKTLTLSFGIFTFLPFTNQESTAKPELQEFLDDLAVRETGETSYKKQRKTVNHLGFTGRFQVGEALLHDLGYYSDDEYYVPGGRKSKNEWKGKFKNGLHSYKDLKKDKDGIQDKIIMEAFLMNKEIIEKKLKVNIADIRKEYSVNKKSKKYTASSILAGAHLCGPYAVIDFFKEGEVTKDENRTKITTYMNEFRGYGDSSVTKHKLKKALEKMED